MDWLVRPLAMTFCGGAVGGSSGRETLERKAARVGGSFRSDSRADAGVEWGRDCALPGSVSRRLCNHYVLLGESLNLPELVFFICKRSIIIKLHGPAL